ncbi:MAG: amino acid adenylation domain-containing protein, partial [bacterium]|nr:amino acid adenylation domain-containing protein [bacterium]
MTNGINQNLLLSSMAFIEQKEYWTGKLSGIDDKTTLFPREIQGGKAPRYEGKELIPIQFSQQLAQRLLKLSKGSDLSIYLLLLTALKVLVFTYHETENIQVMSPIYTPKATTRTVNHLVCLRSAVTAETTFKELLLKVRRTVLEAYDHQDYPFPKLLDYLSLMELIPQQEQLSEVGCLLTNIHPAEFLQETRCPLVFCISLTNDHLTGNIAIDTGAYDAQCLKSAAGHFVSILDRALQDINIVISDIPVLSPEETEQLLMEFNQSNPLPPSDDTIVDVFEKQAARVPDAVACVYEDQAVTYGELTQKAGRLASFLRSHGVKTGDIVALMVGRSIETMVGIWGILKAAAAYLPIDPEYPRARRDFLLKDSSADILLTNSSMLDTHLSPDTDEPETLEMKSYTSFFLDMADLYTEPPTNSAIVPTPGDSAYIIYTSGTTGQPKGVPIRHGSLANLSAGLHSRIYQRYAEKLRVCLLSPFVFDASVKQIFAALPLGHILHIVPEETRIDAEALVRFYFRNHIDLSDGTPTHLRLLVEILKHQGGGVPVKHFVIGGEALPAELVEAFWNTCRAGQTGTEKDHTQPGGTATAATENHVPRAPSPVPNITNVYGPTECCDVAACHDVTPADARRPGSITLGKPMPNVRIYIHGKQNQLLPIGVPGEICIAGQGLSAGYWNNKALTAEKFLPNPRDNQKYTTIYRTGDMGMWLPDGTIRFLGRIDLQVKIRGFRIEPGEIERQLKNHPSVREAVVIARALQETQEDLLLCAYIIPHNIETYDEGELRIYLSAHLPAYIIPSYFTSLESLPLSPNGKVDHKKLPVPQIQGTGKDYVPPRTPIEHKMVHIWSQLLGINSDIISSDANFFELGAHSLKATILAAEIHKIFHVKIQLPRVFATPTIRSLAELIAKSSPDTFTHIPPTEKKEYYPAAPAQKRVYVLQQMEPHNTAYNMPQSVSLDFEVEKEKLEKTFKTLIGRHESFRTSFHVMEDEPIQRVHTSVDFSITYCPQETGVSATAPKPGSSTGDFMQEFIRPFDLTAAPLLRVAVLTEAGSSTMAVDMHHIISDGVSHKILAREFLQLYNGETLPPPVLQYKDYSQWHYGQVQQDLVKKQEHYWLQQFPSGQSLPLLQLPNDYPRPPLFSNEGNTVDFSLGPQETAQLKKLAVGTDTTLYMLVLAMASILFTKLSGQEDIILGSPAAARRHSDLQGIIGMFVNTLALRNFPSGNKTVEDFLKEVKTAALEAMENQDYPFEQLVANLYPRRDTARNPLFDVMVSLMGIDEYKGETDNPKESPAGNIHMKSPNLNSRSDRDGEAEIYSHQPAVTKFDLSLDAIDFGQTIGFRYEYCTRLFKAGTINRFIYYFKQVAVSILENPGREISGIDILSDEEKHRLVYLYNAPPVKVPSHLALHQLFEQRAEKTPDRIAITGTGLLSHHAAATYRNLDKTASQFASILAFTGVGPNTIVALEAQRSVETISCILAILKAGGAYLPLDSEYPAERLRFMLKDSGATHMAAGNRSTSTISFPGHTVYFEDIFHSQSAADRKASTPPSHMQPAKSAPSDLAYIIYTSGSTGLPKGVMIEHRNAVNLAVSQTHTFNVTSGDRILQFSSLCFDASVEQVWLALGNSAVLVLVDKETLLENEDFQHYLISRVVTHLHAVPPFLNNIRLTRHHLKRVIAGGDLCSVALAEKYNTKSLFYNEYGPTETTVTSIQYHARETGGMRTLPIGRPVGNTTVYVLTPYRNLCPPGTAGELFIGGAGVARGYLNRPELTRERFLPISDVKLPLPLNDPSEANLMTGASPNDESESSFLYRTGDLVRWLPDRNLEFMGRNDQQVKIRGFRIEPGEIENRLEQHQHITEAVVIDRGRADAKYLCAYIVPATPIDHPLDTTNLDTFLAKTLPPYMIPDFFVKIEALPLTPSGKIDRKKLPEPGEITPGIQYTAPRDHLEKQLAETFAAVLGMEPDKVGIDFNFFEMGGHSLKATSLISRIHRETAIRLPLATVFSTPTIRKLAAYICSSQKASNGMRKEPLHMGNVPHIAITPAEKKEYYPLSPAQERLYILQQMDLAGTVYNMPQVIPMEGDIDLNGLEKLFNGLIRRQESLRTSFFMLKETPVQRIHESVDFKVATFDSFTVETGPDDENENAVESLFKEFVKPFDLTQAPLLRVGVIKTGSHRHLLLMDMHHIISDGISQDLMEADLAALYAGESLPPLTLQYKDYACWQYANRLEPAGKENAALQESFWLERLQSPIPQLNLPTDFPRPVVRSFEGDLISFVLHAEETRQLQTLVRAEHTTPYMLLLAVFYIWLAKLSRQEDIIVGTPVSGRGHDDLNHIIGMFVNTLALRNFPEEQKSFLSFAKEVKQRTLEDFEHQEYPFEELVEKTLGRRDTSRNPLFDALFTLRQIETQPASPDDTNLSASDETNLSAAPGTIEHRDNLLPQAKFDLTLTVLQKTDETAFLFGYCIALFKPGSMRHFISLFKRIVSSVTRSPHTPIADIDLLSQEERKEVLEDLNRTRTPYPREKTIDRLFSTGARETPDAAGVVYGNSVLTYGELEKLSRNLAHHLVLRGVVHENPVAVSAVPSVEV